MSDPKRGRGRPVSATPKEGTQRRAVRMKPEVWALAQETANAEGISLDKWVSRACLHEGGKLRTPRSPD